MKRDARSTPRVEVLRARSLGGWLDLPAGQSPTYERFEHARGLAPTPVPAVLGRTRLVFATQEAA